MSIVALKKKYLESKNISHNKQFSLNSRRGLQYCKFNMGSLAQSSVKSSSYVHNRRKQWKGLMVDYFPENFDGDTSAFKHICNNWVQTTGSDENYIENKALKAICDNSNNATTESNYCNISKKIDTEPSYVSKKIKTLECSKIGYNRPFPYNGSASKPSFMTCNESPVTQIYNAYEYYGFSSEYDPFKLSPKFTNTAQTIVIQNTPYSYTPTVNIGTITVITSPAWLTFDGTTLSGSTGGVQDYDVKLKVTHENEFVEYEFIVSVTQPSVPPRILGVPSANVDENAAYLFEPIGYDTYQSADELSYSIVNKPAWVNFDTTTGVLSGTPGYGDAGTYSDIVITVTDTESLSASLTPFTITVNNVNRAPTISGSPDNNVDVNATYLFVPGGSDPDDDTITYSIVNQPFWANFDNTTGELSGTPGYGDSGSYSNIQISVSDGLLSASLDQFTITVNYVSPPEESIYVRNPSFTDPYFEFSDGPFDESAPIHVESYLHSGIIYYFTGSSVGIWNDHRFKIVIGDQILDAAGDIGEGEILPLDLSMEAPGTFVTYYCTTTGHEFMHKTFQIL